MLKVKPVRPRRLAVPGLASDRAFLPGIRSPANNSKFYPLALTPPGHSGGHIVWRSGRIDSESRPDPQTAETPVLLRLKSAPVRLPAPTRTGVNSYPICFWLTRDSPLDRR